ncbi:MAG: organic solvent ABC transporter substrate-binding protein [Bdellovibrionaceae bacterium]|nr:organic solvent ABC transporter substrate-binding protein [Pseudobdellovibrionaceae bacterium]
MKNETKVGLMFLGTILMVVVFAYYIGALNPFSSSKNINLAFNFAGGIEVGSPVRVMGIKVGKVESIDFVPEQKVNGEEAKLRIKISVSEEAWPTVKEDSRFFINLAGVIGEKFLEISPGSSDAPGLESGQLVRGEDPPRIDQLISQSYGLAGKVIDMLEKNEGSIHETIDTINSLTTNLNRMLKQLNGMSKTADVKKLVQDLSSLTNDLAYFSSSLRSDQGIETMKLVNELIHRLKGLDSESITKFLQEEGIKAKIF